MTFSIVSNLIEGEETNATIKKLRKNPERFAQFVKTLSIVQFFVEHDQYATKRDIYYQYKHIYKREITLDSFLNELARDIRVPRTSLHIVIILFMQNYRFDSIHLSSFSFVSIDCQCQRSNSGRFAADYERRPNDRLPHESIRHAGAKSSEGDRER